MEETSAIINRRHSAVTLISPPPPPSVDASSSLPFDLVEDILVRLPVKFLLQFRCVCKSWNSLITDNPKFAKKHLLFSKTNRRLLLLTTVNLKSYPIKSTFNTTRKRSNATQLHYPHNWEKLPFNHTNDPIIGSCDGILCLAGNCHEVILWNPSIRKSKELPPFEMSNVPSHRRTCYGFGYDSLSDNYKVVVLIYDITIHIDSGGHRIFQNQVKVHSLGTNFWRKIQEFPYVPVGLPSGIFVSGKLNWLTNDGNTITRCNQERVIVSLDLGNESYQEVLQPDYGEKELEDVSYFIMSVLNDCLSILSYDNVWVMKEYGNKESWTKIFTFPYIEDYRFTKTIYTFEDHQLLLAAIGWFRGAGELALCDTKNGTLNMDMMDNTPEVLVESLISP